MLSECTIATYLNTRNEIVGVDGDRPTCPLDSPDIEIYLSILFPQFTMNIIWKMTASSD